MSDHPFVAYRPPRLDPLSMGRRADEFYHEMSTRRSVRHFSSDPVPRELIELAIRTASTAPSGAHRQPWRFVAISNQDVKHRLRQATEQEERQSYEQRMPDEWRQAIAPMGTNWQKPYLETAPWVVVVFEQLHGIAPDGAIVKNYYVKESVGIACGLFITALHQMGLATLTHTPSPMGYLSELLERPDNERAIMLFPIGYPADDAVVPELHRKPLEDVVAWFE